MVHCQKRSKSRNYIMYSIVAMNDISQMKILPRKANLRRKLVWSRCEQGE